MDRPKLTLVKNPLDAGPGDNDGTEDEWLIDASDLEGVEVEEVDDEEDRNTQGMEIPDYYWNNDEESPGSSSVADNDDNNSVVADQGIGEFRIATFTRCPECDKSDCSRPVQEICGHVKCRDCFVATETACQQCVWRSNKKKEQEQIQILSQDAIVKEEKDDSGNEGEEEEESEEDDERMIITPSECGSELGEVSSGNRPDATVSSETSKELGNQERERHDIPTPPVENEPTTTSNRSEEMILPMSPDSGTDDEANANQNVRTLRPRARASPSKEKKRGQKLKTDHIVLNDSLAGSSATDSKKYKCLKCKKVFSQEYPRRYHIFCDPENGRRPFICRHCPEEFVSQSHYLYHCRSKHTGDKPYKCPICDQGFIQKVKLNRHMTSHTSKPVKAAESLYLCAYCKKRFNSLSSCRRHIRSHTDDDYKPFTCKQCDKSFKHKYSLDAHMRTHMNYRPFKCTDCDKAFSTAKDRRRHYLCHTGELPFECAFDDCTAKFSRKDNLVRHIVKRHKMSEKMAKLLGQEAAKKFSEETQQSEQSGSNSNKSGKGKIFLRDIAEIITGP